MTFSDLRQRPDFIDTIGDRMWQAWWRDAGQPVEAVTGHLREFLDAATFPLGIVAHEGDRYVGSVLLIANDLDERAHLTPWVAALWVEPDDRARGVGAALVERAVQAAFALGYPSVHLCAQPAKSDFYARRGWSEIERGVGAHDLTVFRRHAVES
ncbi:GNAT family N-acetyltransferase [Kaistia dalseonensis]|uniref:N-acetyltransferase YhbS n=1 Tax=Kaistia dalseonensis TaxID=410840 RepID=A0ABU0H8U7_9HYPH|nr:GNAT family N-acetyltransferase [Kaistia dalseonensis]MCX5496114.1 GNAT family N-acetyltransferase [Kaistia dalseonensis]MDQ0438721.1 putative N-acetyltransferase YhbS [Kaistia dalseonensis]